VNMGLHVLLVQTEYPSVQVLERFFQERGDQTWATLSLEEAKGMLDEHKPDLMLLDLHFQDGDWLAFLKTARLHFPKLKIIITNKYPDLQREILASEHGVSTFLRQPFTRNWIENVLQRVYEPPVEATKTAASGQLPKVKMPVGIKIILPYLVLAILFALASAYIVSQVILESYQQRYLNQLIVTGRQTADWMVREEDRLLTTLRQISNTEGMAEAIQKNEPEVLRSLTYPAAVNAHEEIIDILNLQGVSLLAMHLRPGGNPADYEFTSGDTLMQSEAFVRQTLVAGPDNVGDKYSGLVSSTSEPAFYVCGPVFASDGSLVGAVLVGKSVHTLAREAAQENAAEITIYDIQGTPLASTVFAGGDTFPLSNSQVVDVLARQDQSSLSRNLTVTQLDYAEIIGPWEARGGNDLGEIGTALVQTFLTRTNTTVQVEIFILVAVAILLVVGLGLFLSGRITRPLVHLAMASSRVAQGDLEVKVDSQGNDEVAVLAHAFNQMVAGLQEGSVYRDLLGRTVSPEVREQLRQTFTSGNLRLEGQQSVATVLMTDIRGFTGISECSDPATVLAWLNEYFSRVVPAITANGGVVNKFDGDAMLAFFGILPKHLGPKQGAYTACLAALEIVRAVDKLNAERNARGEPVLVTGVGINTGVVIAGGLGSTDRLHYTIIGDTVNTAQRLEALTRQVYSNSGILVGHATCLALGDRANEFFIQPAGTFAVKGKTDQVQVFKLQQANTPALEGTL
jgi:class 3 adenylate cyclase/CheY-like chemotaxis protein